MTDIESRLISFASARQKRTDDARRLAFEKLREHDPSQAQWLREVAKEFGKPDAIRLRFSDGTGYERGDFRSGQDFDDFDDKTKR